MSDSTSKQQLEYTQRGAAEPIQTRVIVEESAGWIRFTDPPAPRAGVRFHVILGAIPAVVSTLVLIFVSPRRLDANSLGISVVAVIFAATAFSYFRAAKRLALMPTVIKVSAHGLELDDPVSGHHHWPLGEIEKIFRNSMIGFRSPWQSWLAISAGRRRFTVLHSRPVREIDWLVERLREALTREW